ncbi:cobalt ABC transporter substrate-binding protein [Pusillimonas sp. TS35]|uniref:DUF4198 domain-containing protein n=1 Tax=Paracandidimonas lactea TaxID=2895524 RepID=UPI0013719CA8|nr:DUF4198 domain-containing protein [Paracandidimonas lactea]MYN14495.1 cobalt ABC transporter substrate-binding protein [Pusillimonas sp. TS35]
MQHRLCLLAAAILLSSSAQAHQIWVETPASGPAIIRFGEFGDNLREASPGLLDMFGAPSATLLSGQAAKPLTVTKTADGFALSARPANGDSIVAEDAAFPLHTSKVNGKEVVNWYWPAARYVSGTGAHAAKLALDAVPTATAGEFHITLKGQPLADAKVNIQVQSGWGKQAHTNKQGLVRFDLPWQGQYVLEVIHTDSTPGERSTSEGPQHYDSIRYVTTLAFNKPDGVPTLPAGPALAPNKRK